MEINLLNLRNSINKAYLKVKPNRTQIETFKKKITNLFDQIKESESEEFHKNIISEFLKNTYYSPNYYINTKGRSDLVIHNGKDSKSTVGVLFEAKKASNKSEMPTHKNINCKAFHELILYFLRERVTNNNLEIKHLVITNIFEWYIFNAADFEKLFADNKNLVKQFIDFEEGRLSGTNTDFFYKNIAEPFVSNLKSDISVTHFDIRDFEIIIKNADKEDDNKLIALYKILSPEHLLKLPFANDSNNLDKTFYNELLHIIGLEETKEGSKKLIGRKIEKKRNPGSLIENSITILKYEDCLSQLPRLSDYGNNNEEQLFNIALELVITWINRILFLKLLEGQLIKYNGGDKTFRFLNIERIHDYDELNKLFFQILAVKEGDRNEKTKTKFTNIPYLNSSLFEPSDLEHKTIRISNLDDHFKLPALSNTVLKDKTGKKLTGEIDPLQYLFEFLDSYDFSSEGSEDIQEENKTLINASVLGLIFEKINGYKDGSFFTPGFITMYMCHETIRRAVVQKFNEAKGWNCETISDVFNEIVDIKESNKIINSLRICDPAVGSGHFLVSALNEIITIKSELKILTDKEEKKLKEYTIEVINDELIITDEQSKLFEYNPKSKESQRVQEALFQEKQIIIENCLFGVDINPNSVKICRLRLWIELLKNAYYKPDTNFRELETLPNIDINIKCGNSLISRYPLDADIKTALKSSKWNVDNYREAVMTYRNAQSKDEKRSMEQLIIKIKNDFETEVSKSDKRYLKLNKLNGELLNQTNQSSLFELTKAQKDEWNKKVKKLTDEINNLETEFKDIKSNKIYQNAFEWRFEFPEVLNNDGDFMGFDVVIGNPPYVNLQNDSEVSQTLSICGYESYTRTGDLYVLFCERGNQILKAKGNLSLIIPNKWLTASYGKNLRFYLSKSTNPIKIIDFEKVFVFEEAVVFVCIIEFEKTINKNLLRFSKILSQNELLEFGNVFEQRATTLEKLSGDQWLMTPTEINSINLKMESIGKKLSDWDGIGFYRGITTGLNEAFVLNKETAKLLIDQDVSSTEVLKKVLRGRNIKRYLYTYDDLYLLYIPWHFPLHKVNSIQKASIKAEASFKTNYSSIYEYLLHNKELLSNRNQSETGLIYEWYALQRFGASYYELFEKEKIVWLEISDKANYAYDNDNMYITNSAYFLAGRSIKYLLAILNSKISDFYFFQKTAIIAGGRKRYTKQYVEQIPIPDIPESQQGIFIQLVDSILSAKKSDPIADTSVLETEIDRLVYELYGLTEEEIRIVENN